MDKTIKEVLSSDEYFMTVAFLAALKSKDPNTKAGACIVKDKKIVGIGKKQNARSRWRFKTSLEPRDSH